MRPGRAPSSEESVHADPDTRPAIQGRSFVRATAILIGISFVARILLLGLTDGSVAHDLRAWVAVARLLEQGRNPYAETDYISWAPFWLQIIYGMSALADVLGIRLKRLFILLFFLIESTLLTVLHRRLTGIVGERRAFRYVLIGIALNPVAMLQIVVHGNFDPLIGLLILLFVVALETFLHSRRSEDFLLASMAAGIGILAKTIPLATLPVLMVGWRKVSRKGWLIAGVLALGPVALALSAVYVLFPEVISERVIHYRSIPGYFGLSGLLWTIGGPASLRYYSAVFVLALLGLMAWFAWRVATARRPGRELVVFATTVLVLFIPLFGPGYGPHYVYWFLPLLVLCHAMMGAAGRRAIEATAVVAAVTYVIEYALIPSHGAFLFRHLDSAALKAVSASISSHSGATLLRIPLFLGLLAVLAAVWRQANLAARARIEPHET